MTDNISARKKSKPLLKIKCFGNFEVFNEDGIVHFSRALGKEAFAYLIDRKGSGCTVSELCSVLWEDRNADKNLKSQCRVVMASLKKDLEKAGATDVLVKDWNSWSVDPERVSCDYYDFLSNDMNAIRSFTGEYMSQYPWGEMNLYGLYNIANLIADSVSNHEGDESELSLPMLKAQVEYINECLNRIERLCREDPKVAAIEARLLSDYLNSRLKEVGGGTTRRIKI